MTEAAEHFDVLIVGAGLSGIGAGYHLQDKCPGKSYAILEGRDCIGGTWDLFRYPGIRSDSDMFTLGYSFKPWTEPKAIADGPNILNYVRQTAVENGIDKKIRFNHSVKRASWSSQDARWTVEAERRVGEGGSETVRFTCNFLFMCSRQVEGHRAEAHGRDGPAQRPEDRLRDAVQRTVDLGQERAGGDGEPRQQDPGEERDEVEEEERADEAGQRWGQPSPYPCSWSRRRSSAETSTFDGVSRKTWLATRSICPPTP